MNSTELKVYCKDDWRQEKQGVPAWQKRNVDGLRSQIELANQRDKRIVSSGMQLRALPPQKTQAWISASELHSMARLGMPVPSKS